MKFIDRLGLINLTFDLAVPLFTWQRNWSFMQNFFFLRLLVLYVFR